MTGDKEPVNSEESADAAAAKQQDESADTTAETGSDLAKELAERTADLQRVTAEYHNYRKRVDRDKALAADQVTASVLGGLLPILDDIDRADEHGDLTGPFRSVADSLKAALGKHGLEVFGEKGDPFDPSFHEAVAHMHSSDVTEPSCIDVMRRGYRMGERLLRPAMVAVAEPEESETEEPDMSSTPVEEVIDEAATGDDNLDADVPSDEEALKAEAVEDAVAEASTSDAEAGARTEEFVEEQPVSETEAKKQDKNE